MANCHHRRVPQVTLTLILCLPCLIAIAALSVWPQMRALIPSSLLQPSYQHHLQKQQDKRNELHLLRPGAASLRGRRPYQEDRLVCAPRIHVPLSALGRSGEDAGLYGVFDGHLGDAASDFAARSLTERFLHHFSSGFMTGNTTFNMSPMAGHPSFNISSMIAVMPWFKASLLAAISDIDAAFTKVAAAHDIKSGSTACTALRVHDQILVANVGDSKAFLCSSCKGGGHRSDQHFRDPNLNQAAIRSYKKTRHRMSRMSGDESFHSHSEGVCVKMLSSDHRPDRPDEKLRIEASGGFVTGGSLPRVNGLLAVSRSIGDIDLRRYGVISEPELSGWHQISDDDKFLILASDGIFEKLSPQEVCNVLHALGLEQDLTSIMDRLEEENGAVIALPGVDVSKDSLNQGAHMLKSDSHSLTSSFARIATLDACQGDDSSAMTLTPFFQDASAIAQIMAQILVELAFRAGSMDNLSAVVVPLKASTV
eukprot:c25134_g1_i2 orf=1085-2527(-)